MKDSDAIYAAFSKLALHLKKPENVVWNRHSYWECL